jgi:glutathione S-transferase
LADIAIGAFARRWLGIEGVTKPKLPHLERWFAQISQRPGFQQFLAKPMT